MRLQCAFLFCLFGAQACSDSGTLSADSDASSDVTDAGSATDTSNVPRASSFGWVELTQRGGTASVTAAFSPNNVASADAVCPVRVDGPCQIWIGDNACEQAHGIASAVTGAPDLSTVPSHAQQSITVRGATATCVFRTRTMTVPSHGAPRKL